MATAISISNQKGGVRNSVTTAPLGPGLARQGKKVLTMDAAREASLIISPGFPIPVTLGSSYEQNY